MSLGTNGALNGFVPSPSDSWHQNISSAPVDPMSNNIISTDTNGLKGSSLHPDFANPNTYIAGIPYTVVDSSTQAPVAINVGSYASQSDVSAEPIPAGMAVEGNQPNCTNSSSLGDAHAIILDRATCVAYEMYQANYCASNSPGWTAQQTTIWDFTEEEKRPLGWTSVDAAGLSVFEGLIRYDEIAAGVINHAIRFTANFTKNDANGGYFVPPATHAAGNNYGNNNVIGLRLRLNASFDISGFSPTNQIILTAMKQYGMILADNGSNLYIQGTPDTRWNDDDLANLGTVGAANFEVVDAPGSGNLAASYTPGIAPMYPAGVVMDAMDIPTGNVPLASLTASATEINSGESVTLAPSSSGASYSYIDKVGFVRGPVSVSPTATTTYTLYSNNAYGSASATPVTITVMPGTAISKNSELTFVAVPTQNFGDAPFTVSATSKSSGAMTFASLTPEVATVSGHTVTIKKPGAARLSVGQAAAGGYPASTTTTAFTVAGEASDLTFVVEPHSYPGIEVRLSAESRSGGAITYSVVSGHATLTNSRYLELTGTGTVTVMAQQAAYGNYASSSLTTSFRVSAAN